MVLILDPIDNFFAAGASKRGWTTWTIGSVDKRLKGISPIVLDSLNLETLFPQWWQNLGGWSFALEQYWNEDIMSFIGTPEFTKMSKIIDPY